VKRNVLDVYKRKTSSTRATILERLSICETFKPRNDGEFYREGQIRCLRIGPQTTRPPKGGLSLIR